MLELAGARNGLPEAYGYWGELMAAAKAKELGAVGAGGDLFADGALGARTAHLSVAYVDGETADSCGHGYLTAEQVAEHIVDCVQVGVQGGFHAIGDEHKTGYYGVLTQGFPQLVRVNRDVLTRDNQTPVPAGQPMLCRVRMVHEFPLIPDLEAIEQRLAAIAA